jgi:hypothetical protein
MPVKASSPLPVKASSPLPVKASQKVDTLSLLLAFVSSATSITLLSAGTILVKYVSYV